MSNLYLFLGYVFNVLSFVVLARALLSWFPIRPDNPIKLFLDGATDPILYPLRKILPSFGMFDLSPLVAIIVLQVMANLSFRLA